MNAIALNNNSISNDFYPDTTWLDYFDISAARYAVNAHIANLPSDKTPEKHTRSVYERGINYFINWAGGEFSMPLPTEQLMTTFIAHLLHEKQWTKGKTTQYGISATSACNAYLAPLKVFLKNLLYAHKTVHGWERDYVMDCRDRIQKAIDLKNPSTTTTSNIAPLWNPKFTRLTINQVKQVLHSLDTNTIAGARDYALLLLAFASGLRIAEIQRITLDKIKPQDENYVIIVRGKRSKTDPVPIDTTTYQAIIRYITMYNNGLSPTDTRRIKNNTPLFQPMKKYDKYCELDTTYDQSRGITTSAMRRIIRRRTAKALGEKLTCTPHDCRRTFAAIAYNSGMELPQIQLAMRHNDVSTTMRYVGNKPDYNASLLSNFVNFT